MTNIKYLQRFFFALFVGLSMCSIQACSDDDDNEGGGSTGTLSTNVGEIVAGSGKKLLSAGILDFYYSPEGKIKYIVENDVYDDYQAYHEFSSNQITSYYDYGYDEKEKEVLTLSYNEKGYISKIHMYEYEEGEGGSETYSSISDISYDGEGHVVKITAQGVHEDIYNGETNRFEHTQTINFKWDDGLLVGIESMNKENDGWGYSESITFKYGDREYKNMHNQYASFIDEMFGGISSACAYIGLFGTGPDYLPVSITSISKEFDGDGYVDEWTDSESYIYEFNEDGTIRRANSEYFTYGTINEQGEFSPNESEYQAKATRAGQIQRRHALFGNRLKSRR